MNFADNSRSC